MKLEEKSKSLKKKMKKYETSILDSNNSNPKKFYGKYRYFLTLKTSFCFGHLWVIFSATSLLKVPKTFQNKT